MTTLNLPRDPTTAQAAVDIADHHKLMAIQLILEQMRGKPFGDDAEFKAELAAAMEELDGDQEFWAKVEAEALAYTARMEDAHGRSVEYQAVQIAASDRWQFHPEHHKTVAEHLQSALQGTTHGSGTFYRIRWLAGTFVPWCLAHGVNAVENIWDENARTKAQYMAERLMGNFKAEGIYPQPGQDAITPEQAGASIDGATQEKLDGMLAMVTDPEVTVAEMKEKFPVTQSRIPAMNTWRFPLAGADYFVTECLSSQQAALYERLLGGKMTVQLGTGQEPFLSRLSQRR